MTEGPPTYVVDASVAVKWVLRGDESLLADADALLEEYRAGSIHLIAPPPCLSKLATP